MIKYISYVCRKSRILNTIRRKQYAAFFLGQYDEILNLECRAERVKQIRFYI